MYDLGTPLSTLGWALPSLQAKNQDVVVPLWATLNVVYAKRTYVVLAYPYGILWVMGLASPHNPSRN